MSEVIGSSALVAKLAAIGQAGGGKVLLTALQAGGLVLTDGAKRRAPADTGNLRRSIHMETDRSTPVSAQVSVGTDVEYAIFQEFGPNDPYVHNWTFTPFLRPALDEEKPAILAAIDSVLVAAMKGAALA